MATNQLLVQRVGSRLEQLREFPAQVVRGSAFDQADKLGNAQVRVHLARQVNVVGHHFEFQDVRSGFFGHFRHDRFEPGDHSSDNTLRRYFGHQTTWYLQVYATFRLLFHPEFQRHETSYSSIHAI